MCFEGFGSASNKYTSIRQLEAVDYVIARHADMHLFSKCQINAKSEVTYAIKYLISDKSRISNYSVILCECYSTNLPVKNNDVLPN